MTTDYTTIIVSQDGRVGTVQLDRPKALNALNSKLMDEVVAAIEDFDASSDVGAIVLKGSERAFAAGADITEMASLTFAEVYVQNWFSAWDRLARVRTPIVAEVSGYALGGGCELAMMCDLIIASTSAVFGQPEINLATIPGMGGSQRLTKAIGKAKAMDLVLTGRQMNADEAERAGLVSRVVEPEFLAREAMDVAKTIASKSLPVAYMAKEAVNESLEVSTTEGVRFERRAFQSTFALDDRAEGMEAFVQKRPPNFAHR